MDEDTAGGLDWRMERARRSSWGGFDATSRRSAPGAGRARAGFANRWCRALGSGLLPLSLTLVASTTPSCNFECTADACETEVPPPREAGFRRSVVDGGVPFEVWQVVARMSLASWFEPHPSARSFVRKEEDALESDCPDSPGLRIDRFEASSGVQAGAFYLAKGTKRRLAVVLHGHGDTAASAFRRDSDVFGIGCELVRAGWWVAVPELAGFGLRDEVPHDALVATRPDGFYMRTEIAMLNDVVDFLRDETPRRTPDAVIGHSLGSHLALQLAALRPEIGSAFLSSLFLPLACINSCVHHACQHQPGLPKAFEIEDLAMLVAPRRITIEWGENDPFFTPAAREVAARARAGYRAIGAAGALRVVTVSNLGHRLDPAAVLDLLHELQEPAPRTAGDDGAGTSGLRSPNDG